MFIHLLSTERRDIDRDFNPIMPRPVEGVFKVIMLILLLFVQLSLHKFVFFRSIYER